MLLRGDAVGRPGWESPLLSDPYAKFSMKNWGRAQKEKKRAKKKEAEADKKEIDRVDIVRDGR